MTKKSMLATVRAAAQISDSPADDKTANSPLEPTEENMAGTKKGEVDTSTAPKPKAAEGDAITLESIKADHPEIVAVLHAEGATTERERITGIEAHTLAGHEDLITEMKEDGSVSPDMAAGRIVQAEKQARANQAQGIQDVEKLTGSVKASPSALGSQDPAAALSNKPENEKTEDDFKAEYEGGPADINKQVTSESDYIALRKAEAAGRVKVLGTRAA